MKMKIEDQKNRNIRFNSLGTIKPGFRRRTPTSATQRLTTPSAERATSGPTRPTGMKSKISVKPFRKYILKTTTIKPIENQVATPAKHIIRNRLFTRRPHHATPQHRNTTPAVISSPSTLTYADDVTELRDLAIALNIIQKAPVPSESKKEEFLIRPYTPVSYIPQVTPTPPQRVNGLQSRRTLPRITVNKPIITLTTMRTTSRPHTIRYLYSNESPVTAKPDPLTFYRVASPSIPLRHQSLDDDFYLTGMSQLPTHSKVLLHSSGVIECLDQGSFPHPVSCRKFISCSKMDNDKILGWEYTCPKNLSFDPIGGMCNWSAGLGCDEN